MTSDEPEFGYLYAPGRGILGPATEALFLDWSNGPVADDGNRYVLVNDALEPWPDDEYPDDPDSFEAVLLARTNAELEILLHGGSLVGRETIKAVAGPRYQIPQHVLDPEVGQEEQKHQGPWSRAVNRPIFWVGAPLLFFGLWSFFGGENSVLIGGTLYRCPTPSEIFLATGWVDVYSIDGNPSRAAYTLCKQAQTPWAVGSVVSIVVGAVLTLLAFVLPFDERRSAAQNVPSQQDGWW